MNNGALHSFPTVPIVACVVSALMSGGAHAQQGAEVTPDVTQELAAVRTVLHSAPMTRALEYIDESHDETLQEFLQICSSPGPSQDESYRARSIYRLMSIYGLSNVHIDDENNVIGVRKGTGGGPTVVINAHHDNVRIWPRDQPIAAFIADGRVWCPAARDDLVGVVQALLALRAMNAGNIQTKGDVWFVTLSGEEPFRNKRSPGAEYFVRSNYPHNLDWRKGDIMVQLHGGGGEGISTGSVNLRHSSQLRVFMPVVRPQWSWHAMDVLGKVMSRVTSEVRPTAARENSGRGENFMVINMSNPEPTDHPMNESVQGASIRFNFQIQTERRVDQAHEQIQRIAREVCADMGEGCTYHYTVNTRNGTEQGLPGFDNVNNSPARFAAAAAKALYNTSGTIAPRTGCGDCVRSYQNGMPAFSVRGSVLDLGGGKFRVGDVPPLDPAGVRRATETHDITDSVPIDEIWAGPKHIMLFAVSYAGLSLSRD